ncbi:transposase, partial [Pseudomonas sp. ATCC 13867]
EVILETFMRDDKINLSGLALMVNNRLEKGSASQGAPAQLDRKPISRMIQRMPKGLVREGRLDPRTFALWNRQACAPSR